LQKAGNPELVFWLETTSQAACEMASLIGYDGVIFDMEHGVIGAESADQLVAYCRALRLRVFVRVSTAERVEIQQALDAGADAVILPQIRDVAHAKEAAEVSKFPPRGTRGIGYSRTMGYRGPADGFPAEENSSRRCYIMIETPGALADAAQIAALETVDGLFLGPSDLSLTRGRGVNRWSQEDRQDMSEVARAAKTAGKTWAMPAANREIFDLALPMKPEYLAVTDDLSALYTGLEGAFKTFAFRRSADAKTGGS
jgi:2-keto-3-deoxy-L-rhamnonate aldolase RhmA